MKTNLWKLSCMVLAIAAITTSCTQNEELETPTPSNDGDVLNVVATANDFVSSDPTSRVSEANYTTTFEEGDAIGVFVVRDGEALVSNMKMTLGSDNVWAGENDAKLYYYKDADYIAYSPYTEGLSVTSEAEIISHFTTKLQGSTGQSTLADYQAADLMTASVAAAEVTRGQNITFSFAHKMSMIEIKVPIRAYKTSGTTPYEYSAPLGLSVEIDNAEYALCTFGKETTGESGSEVTKGIYRCIVAPSETTLNVEGEFQDGSVPVYFHATAGTALSVTPIAGEYKGIDVNYPYADHSGIVERDLQVGDYYYADGSIWPEELDNAPKTDCVGIIFSTVTSDTDQGLKWSHGYVIALENTTGEVGTYSKWGTGDLDGNKLDINSPLTNMDGYTISDKLSDSDAVKAAKEYAVTIPENTSGWYLPSAAQLAAFLNNMCSNDGWVFNETNAYDNGKDQEKKVSALQSIEPKFSKVGGYLLNTNTYSSAPGADVTSDRWWSTTEVSSSQSWALELKSNGQVKLLERNKSDNQASVRPVFAF